MTNDPDTLPFLTLRTDALPKAAASTPATTEPRNRPPAAASRRSDRSRHPRRCSSPTQRIVREDSLGLRRQLEAERVTTERVKGFELQPSFLLNLAHVSKAAP